MVVALIFNSGAPKPFHFKPCVIGLSSVGLGKRPCGYTDLVVLSLACPNNFEITILCAPCINVSGVRLFGDTPGDNQTFQALPPAERKLERCLSGFRNKNNLGQKSRYGSATLTSRNQ